MKVYKFIFAVAIPMVASAGELSYFENRIDFWGDGKATKEALLTIEKNENDGANKFPWKTYLDPKNKEFFKEGDYTPPEPFMEIARNPTDENIKQWFEFMKKKNELARRLDDRVREYLVKEAKVASVTRGSGSLDKPVRPEPTLGQFDATRFKVRMYFESTCPHCKRMFGVLKRLQDEGVEVHALQTDRGPLPLEAKAVSTGFATQEEVKKNEVESVPFLVIADTKRKILLPPVRGYHEFGDVMGLMKNTSH